MKRQKPLPPPLWRRLVRHGSTALLPAGPVLILLGAYLNSLPVTLLGIALGSSCVLLAGV